MKDRIILLALLSLISLLVLILLAVPTSQATGLLAGKSICLDPGHGGYDPGATNVEFNLYEKSINLDVSVRLKQLLEGQDAVVFMTRDDDESYLTNSDRYTYCNERQALYEMEDMILVSVHTNSVVDDSWDGGNTLYGPREDPDLAQAIHDVMYPYLQGTVPTDPEDPLDFIDFGVDKFASGVLFKSDMPAAMVEPLFMSNRLEAPLLDQTIYDNPTDVSPCVNEDSGGPCRREQIAQAVFGGIKNYFAEPQFSSMHVASIDMTFEKSRAFYFITTVVLIQDENGDSVSGAVVRLDITKPDLSTVSKSVITGDEGVGAYTLRSKTPGEYIAAIVDVSKSGFAYWPDSNVESSESRTVPD